MQGGQLLLSLGKDATFVVIPTLNSHFSLSQEIQLGPHTGRLIKIKILFYYLTLDSYFKSPSLFPAARVACVPIYVSVPSF